MPELVLKLTQTSSCLLLTVAGAELQELRARQQQTSQIGGVTEDQLLAGRTWKGQACWASRVRMRTQGSVSVQATGFRQSQNSG